MRNILRTAVLVAALMVAVGADNLYPEANTMDTPTPTTGVGRRPVLTTVTGLSAADAERQTVAGTHQAQNPALLQTLAAQARAGETLEMATRPIEPDRATLMRDHADTLHRLAAEALTLPPGSVMLGARFEGEKDVTAAQMAAACMRALMVAAPSGWGALELVPAAEPVEITFRPSEKLERAMETAETPPPTPQPQAAQILTDDSQDGGADENVDPIATLVGDVRARLSGSESVSLVIASLPDGARSALEAHAKLDVHEEGDVLVVRERGAPPEIVPPVSAGVENQPPAGGGTGADSGDGMRKELIPPTQCPFCDAAPFGSPKGRDAHIRAKHPDREIPQKPAVE